MNQRNDPKTHYIMLQAKYLKLRKEVEKFLKKKSGYRELRKVIKEISYDQRRLS